MGYEAYARFFQHKTIHKTMLDELGIATTALVDNCMILQDNAYTVRADRRRQP